MNEQRPPRIEIGDTRNSATSRLLLVTNLVLVVWTTFWIVMFAGLAVTAVLSKGREVSGRDAIALLVGFVILGCGASLPATFLAFRFLKPKSVRTLVLSLLILIVAAWAVSPVPFFSLEAHEDFDRG